MIILIFSTKINSLQRSDRGPATAIGDLNGDGKEDVFFGGSKNKEAAVYSKSKGFSKKSFTDVDSIYEDASAVIGDFNNDKINDLFSFRRVKTRLIYRTVLFP
jgi:hypothetical protein